MASKVRLEAAIGVRSMKYEASTNERIKQRMEQLDCMQRNATQMLGV